MGSGQQCMAILTPCSGGPHADPLGLPLPEQNGRGARSNAVLPAEVRTLLTDLQQQVCVLQAGAGAHACGQVTGVLATCGI